MLLGETRAASGIFHRGSNFTISRMRDSRTPARLELPREPLRPPLAVCLQLGGELTTGSIQAAHDRALLAPEQLRGLAVGEPDDVDRDDGLSQRIREITQRRVHGAGLDDLCAERQSP